MSFIERHFIPVWISIIVAVMAGLGFYFFYLDVTTIGHSSGEYPWYAWVCAIVAITSLFVPIGLFIHHRIALRAECLSRSVVETFE